MAIEPELLDEIRAILKRECAVEVTVTFYDESDGEPLDPIDISESVEFDPDTPHEEREREFNELLGSLTVVFREASRPPSGT